MRNPARRRVRGVLLATCALSTPMLFASARPVWAQETAQSEPLIEKLNLRDAPMETAVQILQQQSGIKNVVIARGVYGRVNLSLSDVTPEKALRTIAEAAGAVVKFEDGIYYIRLKGDEPEPKPAPVVVVKQPEAPKRSSRPWVPIRLNYLPPSEFVKILKDPSYRPFLDYIKAPDSPLKFAQPGQAVPSSGILFPTNSGPATTAAGQAGGSDPGGVNEAGQRGGFGGGGIGGGGIGGGGRPGGLGGAGGGIGGAGGGIGGGLGGGLGGGQGQGSIRPDDIDSIITSDADNTLIVQGSPTAIEQLRSLVRLLDIAPKQVLIKAEFVQVSLQDTDAFGISWQFSPSQNLDVNIPTSPGATPTVTMAYSSGNAVAALRAALTKSTTNILQAPIISTTNNMPASIQVNDTVLIPQSVVIPLQNGNTVVAPAQPIPITASNALNIVPHINGDNSISLFLTPQLQTNSVTPGAAGQVNIRQSTQFLTTFRRIRNGETMVLGGFITRQENDGETRVPILSDLPIIGSLFTQKSKAKAGLETLVFVTATVIDDLPGGGAGPAL